MSSLSACAFWNKRVMKMLKIFYSSLQISGFFFIKGMMFKGGRMSRKRLRSAGPK